MTTHSKNEHATTLHTSTPDTVPTDASSHGVKPTAPASTSMSHPSAADIAAALEELDAIASSLGPNAKPLTIADRRRLLKIRPGGLPHVTAIVGLATRYGLTIPGLNAATVAEDAQLVGDIAPLLARLDVVQGLVNDINLQAESRLWRAAVMAYGMLARLVPQFPALQRELTPIASFLAHQYKDAPMAIRPQEKAALRRTRSKKKGAPATKTGSAPASDAPSTPKAPAADPPAAPAADAKTGG